MATLGMQGTRQRKKKNDKTKSKSTQKNTAQYVLNITILKQIQITLINPPTNNESTKEQNIVTDTTSRNSETPNRTTS